MVRKFVPCYMAQILGHEYVYEYISNKNEFSKIIIQFVSYSSSVHHLFLATFDVIHSVTECVTVRRQVNSLSCCGPAVMAIRERPSGLAGDHSLSL